MKLPKIYEHFKQGQVFTINEARLRLGTTGNTLRKRLSELAARGYIHPIRQGLYRVSRMGETPQLQICSPFAIATKLTPYCYIGYKTALQLHAKEEPAPFDKVYVVSPTKFNSFEFESRMYFWSQSPDPHGLDTYLLEHEGVEFPVLATNFEKSLIDCLKRPSYCPPFLELLRLCKAQSRTIQFDKMLRYALDCQVQTIFNRIGFLFEHCRQEWGICDLAMKEIERHMCTKQTEWPITLRETRPAAYSGGRILDLGTSALSPKDFRDPRGVVKPVPSPLPHPVPEVMREGKLKWKLLFY
jgi:predicted transcriptional regulator of viral defense system